ncbi:MAG: sodium:solute symporter family protein [Aminobacterium sp.]|jgi:sodium/pantothenate symporter|nr:sodium:solute symporter family protein [Aminobacterium sp.]MDD3425770.1 sodium:solute symporter family protein [Aminobacterium sp.]MDD4228310.1 sodium:solute symporter family protein [Aminobacterium sp.]MDD4551781.1 sodium:solute symporter family protein [Aminobacterium sp.]
MDAVSSLIHPIPGIFYTVLGGYFVIMALIGYYSAKNTSTLSDFFVMSGKAGAIVSGLAYFSTQYSMSTFMGCPATCYKVGFAGLTISVPGLVFSMIIPALFVGRKLVRLGHKHGFLTMADYLGDRYESDGLRVLLAVLMIIFLIPMMGAQTIGAGIILRTFTGAPEWVGIVAMGIIVILYCMSGGIRGAMLTDVIQGSLMVLTAIITFIISVKIGGGFSAISEKLHALNPAYMSHPGVGGSYGWGNYVSMIVMWSFFSIGQPGLFTKFFAMKDYKVMFKAVLLGTLGMWLAATLIEWSGVNAIVSIPGLTGKQIDFVVPLILQQGVSPIVSTLLIAGIMAAGMSTIDSLLIVSTGAVTRDIYQKLINKDATDAQIFRLSRIVTVIIGVIAILFGISRPATIFKLILFAFGGLGIWSAPIIMGMYWKGATKAGAFASVIVGEILFVLMTLKFRSWAFGFNPLIICWIYAMLVMVIVSKFTQPASTATIKKHFA